MYKCALTLFECLGCWTDALILACCAIDNPVAKIGKTKGEQEQERMATLDEQIAAAEARAEAARKRVQQLKTRQADAEARELRRVIAGERAEDTRRKILMGALVLEMVERGEMTQADLMSKLDAFLVRDGDRKLFDLASRG
jgi:hypothetical protein